MRLTRRRLLAAAGAVSAFSVAERGDPWPGGRMLWVPYLPLLRFTAAVAYLPMQEPEAPLTAAGPVRRCP